MEGLDLRSRWSDPQYLAAAQPILTAVFLSKKFQGQADLRALVIALEGGPSLLHEADFRDSDLEGIDASDAQMACSFFNASIRKSTFDRARFDTCYFKAARFSDCTFSGSKVESPTLDDAVFASCSFENVRLNGRGTQEYGGRRVVFDACTFDGAVFQNLQLRACIFRNCTFAGATFRRCLVVGAKFEGGTPDPSSFVDCG